MNRTVLITGGAKGIGKSTAFKFVKKGYKVFIVDILNKELEETMNELNELSGKKVAYGLSGDVSNSSFVDESVKKAESIFNGKIDILVNNAGIVPATANNDIKNFIDTISDEDLLKTFSVNIFSMFYYCRAIARKMKELRNGVIINIGSVSSTGLHVNSHYAASKAAVEGFTRSIAVELSFYNISAFCISPGLVNTELIKPMTEYEKNLFIKFSLTKEIIPAWEVANLILYLAHPDAKNLTGQIFHINAGTSLR